MKPFASPAAHQVRQLPPIDIRRNGRGARPFPNSASLPVFDRSPDPIDAVSMRILSAAESVPVSPLARARIEALVEHLIALLDASDADPDAEPDADDEPSIDGRPSMDPLSGASRYVVDGELDDADAEPWLGWSSLEAMTGKYDELGALDLEDEVDRERDEDFEWSISEYELEADYSAGGMSDGVADAEPSAGWTERHSQREHLAGRPAATWTAADADALANVVKFTPA